MVFPRGDRQEQEIAVGLRGVNLGGWLILERWMTPALFAGTDARDEYEFMQTPGAREKIARWRETFITDDDFAWLAAHGIDAVRIPVGYWVLAGDPPYADARGTLDWAFSAAHRHGLKVLLDLHGLPGSQNGNDHSGRVGRAGWQGSPANRDWSLAVLRDLAARYRDQPSLWGVQVINEPNAAALQLFLRGYYRRAYRLLAHALPDRVMIVYSDAWSPRLLAFALPFRRRAVMDVHLYHMTTLGATSHDLAWFYRKLRRRVRMLRRIARRRSVIIGEWSGVVSHETYARYPELDQNAVFEEFTALQQELYGGFTGWFYWSYKTEGPGQWSYRARVEAGDL